MSIYIKYISRAIFPPLITSAIVLTSLVWITQTLRMAYLLDKGIDLSKFLKFTTLLIPSLLFMILPIITVITVIYVYNKLQDDRQIVIFRSSGLSNFDIAKPALVVATITTIIAYYLSAHLMPLSYNNLKQGLNDFKENYVSNIIDEKTFNQISKHSTIYVDRKNSNGSLEGVVLFDNKSPEKKTVLFAQRGHIRSLRESVTEFELTNGVRHSYDQSGNLTKLKFESLIVAVGSEQNEVNVRTRTSLELYIQEMLWPDESIAPDRQKRLIAEGHSRIIWPLFNFAFVCLALSIFLRQPYNRKSHIKQFVYTFVPILLVAYLHFSMQKIAYKDLDYIFLCYANLFLCIIFGIWQSTKNSL